MFAQFGIHKYWDLPKYLFYYQILYIYRILISRTIRVRDTDNCHHHHIYHFAHYPPTESYRSEENTGRDRPRYRLSTTTSRGGRRPNLDLCQIGISQCDAGRSCDYVPDQSYVIKTKNRILELPYSRRCNIHPLDFHTAPQQTHTSVACPYLKTPRY